MSEAPRGEAQHREEQAWAMIAHRLGRVLDYFAAEYTEIMANPDGRVWVDSHTEGQFCTPILLSEADRRAIIETVATYTGQICDEAHPHLDGVLPVKRLRFAGLHKPAVESPSFSIRLTNGKVMTLREYVDFGTLTQEQARLLLRAMTLRQNVLIVGGTGSGKTMFSNALLDLMKHTGHRIMTIEDTPELHCQAPNHVSVRVNRQGAFQYKQALHMALRFRPDRIVVGELRDGLAALELLKAWNTGHNGGLATLHANSAKSAFTRLEQLLEEEVARVPKALIAEAVDVVVFMERYTPTGSKGHAWRAYDVAHVQNELGQGSTYQLTHCYHPTVKEAS